MSALTSGVISLKDLLKEKVAIPYYQRPYVWDAERVRLLLSDLDEFLDSKNTEKPEKYLLGSIIFHKNGENLDVVDGQQRLVSLSLILEALGLNGFSVESNSLTKSKDNKEDNSTAIKVWFENHEGKREHFRQNLPEKIEFVCVFTNDLDNAFTFFDNTNAKGKRLESYDLIKAFHLWILKGDMQKYYAKEFEKLASDEQKMQELLYKILAPARNWLRDLNSNKIACQIDTYAEFCKEISKNLHCKNVKSEYPLGILQNFLGGADFFDYLRKFDTLYEQLKSVEFYKNLCEINWSGFIYNRLIYAMCAIIYLDKFKDGESEYMLRLIARAAFSLRCGGKGHVKIVEESARDFAKEILPLIYYASFEGEVEVNLMKFIASKKKAETENAENEQKNKSNAGKVDYLATMQKEYEKFNIPAHPAKMPAHPANNGGIK